MHRIIYLIANSAERKIRQIRHQIKNEEGVSKTDTPSFFVCQTADKIFTCRISAQIAGPFALFRRNRTLKCPLPQAFPSTS